MASSFREVHCGEANAITVGVRELMGSLFLDRSEGQGPSRTRWERWPWYERWRQSLWLRTRSGKAGESPLSFRPRRRSYPRDLRAVFGRRDAKGNRLFPKRAGRVAARGSRWNASDHQWQRGPGYGILRNSLYNGTRLWNRVRMALHPDTGKRDQLREFGKTHGRVYLSIISGLFRVNCSKLSSGNSAIALGLRTPGHYTRRQSGPSRAS